jgi:methionine-gamma-lyase
MAEPLDPSTMKPESLMMSYGYKPQLSEGSLKPPLFLTSTFVFKSAEDGKRFFEVAYGLSPQAPGEELGLIYSRINNPNLEILEDRLALWDEADASLVFESGMAAISTVLLEFLKPGDLLLHSNPVYGGTHHFIQQVLPAYGIDFIAFDADSTEEELVAIVEASGKADRLKLVYAETPANPTNALIDLEMLVRVAKRFGATTCVDNTYLGPMWQKPLRFGIDLVVYSATKFIGGHSDLIAGSVSGRGEAVGRVRVLRTFLGNMASPHTCWMLLRSLETLKIRTDREASNARKIADYLARHPKVERVHYLGHLRKGEKFFDIFEKQCNNAGAMVSFDIIRGEKAAFRFLDALRLIHLAVSLGGTESLASHPASMTHCDIPIEQRAALGISEKLVRLSVGVEDAEDLISDLENALRAV